MEPWRPEIGLDGRSLLCGEHGINPAAEARQVEEH
jgi:hypothetical protein